MEFGQQMTDILGNVSCNFEMYIFKIAQVINKNVRIAFLYVLSIFTSRPVNPGRQVDKSTGGPERLTHNALHSYIYLSTCQPW